MLHQLHLALESGVEVILNVVISAAWQKLSDLGPLVAKIVVQLNNFSVLIICPLVFLDIRVQVIVPPLAALLADTAR